MAQTLQPFPTTYFGPPLQDAHVGDAMRVGVVTCRPTTSLIDVARIMLGYRIHSVLVQDVMEREPRGIVTDMEVAGAVAAGSVADLTAADVAANDVVTVRSNEKLQAAAGLMRERGVSHLLVVQPETGDPVGVISALGLTGVVAATSG